MAQINTGSNLLETLLTPEESYQAVGLFNRELAIAYLQNSRIEIFRQLAEQQFTDPKDDGENHRIRAYLKGQYDILGSLIDGALNPPPVPVSGTGDSSQPS